MFFFEYYLEFQKKLLPRQPYGNTTLKYVHSSQKSFKKIHSLLFRVSFFYFISYFLFWVWSCGNISSWSVFTHCYCHTKPRMGHLNDGVRKLLHTITLLHTFPHDLCNGHRHLMNRGPDRSGSCRISIWQLPYQSGSWLILPYWLSDRSGNCLILIRQWPDQSGGNWTDQAAACFWSGRCLTNQAAP